MKRIPVSGPWITEREVAYAAEAAEKAWYEHWNDYNERFEHEFASYLDIPHAMSLPSCTAALHLAMAALGIGPGDEVIVPEVTWIASAVPATYQGAIPVFADIDPETWCVTAATIERCITPATKAIVVVDLYGITADMDPIMALARRHGIPVIEDAAEAMGSAYNGRKAGTLGDIGVFSFHGSKTMTTGEGGMLVTRDTELFRRCGVLRDHGRHPDVRTKLWCDEIGFKYRMTAFQAAIGIAQLERIEELIGKKREIFGWYHERLGANPRLTLNVEPEGLFSTYWQVNAILDPSLRLTKEDVGRSLDENGIDSRPMFYPLSSSPAFARIPGVEVAVERNRVAYDVSPRGINLPSALRLTRDDVMRVCDVVEAAVR